MTRKPGRMYRQIKGAAFTRKEYMGGVPAPRITQFVMGNTKGSFPLVYHLIAKEPCQIRHTALEAARIAANRHIQKKAGAANYKLIIRVYPHHIIRENKQATGAGADRVSQGMRRSYGKPIGSAARVQAGQILIVLQINPNMEIDAKIALRKASMKLPTPAYIVKLS